MRSPEGQSALKVRAFEIASRPNNWLHSARLVSLQVHERIDDWTGVAWTDVCATNKYCG